MAFRTVKNLILLKSKHPPKPVDEGSVNKYCCVYCIGLLRPPVKMLTCGHRVCMLCLDELIPKGQGCPGGEEDCGLIDLGDDSVVYPDFGTERELKNLLVFCFNQAQGCPVEVQWKNLEEHLIECCYKTVECPFSSNGCLYKSTQKNVSEHLNSSCPFVELTCPKCEEPLMRKDLEQHDCSTVKPCQYESMGCTFQSTVVDLKRHLNNDHSLHLDIMLDRLNQVQENIQGFSREIEFLQGENGSLHKQLGKITNHVAKQRKLQTEKIRFLEKLVGSTKEKALELMASVTALEQTEEMQKQTAKLEERIRKLESHLSGSWLTNQPHSDLNSSLHRIEQALELHSGRMSELDSLLQNAENTTFDGVFVWKISNYRKRKQDALTGKAVFLYSQPFFTSAHGYKMAARIYPNGDGLGKGTHLSIFIAIMKGQFDQILPWPFRHKIAFYLLNQEAPGKYIQDVFQPDTSSNSFQMPVSEVNIATGCPLFAEQSVVESSKFLRDDCIFIKIVVDKREYNI